MNEIEFKFIPDTDLDKMSLDELKKERTCIQNVRLQTKPYLHKITLLINGILQENEALRKLTPETARALGMPEDKIKLIEELQAKRKKALAEGKEDVIIQHRHTLTLTAKGAKHKTEVN